ncbi:CPBP family intramembrane glutamic endopeptidase [Bacillus testis]|uniref:CPBP family intramembrane glutamic endopeptidase n=1 Tax=Bacillus testis TaxID=1622072 RepID=UPI00067F1DBF|nr:CPBP family intramembrane glutamic endopeptidase [Bacillus testis]
MKACATDFRFVLSLVSAQILLYLTYQYPSVFWYLYTASILFLVCFTLSSNSQNSRSSITGKNMLYGILSAILLYAVFALGNELFSLLHFKSLAKDVSQLYKLYSPSALWQFAVLFLILIPGEELFWRGFIQKKLSAAFTPLWTILTSAILYSIPMLYAQNNALLLAGLAGGLMWGFLYQWKKSLFTVILSHMVFDFILLYLLPLH